ncbi:MAG TPA: Gfo/Idh/MocA family oxidoreductase, partial [Sedimentisphaerales bacterium]|nr:Gfo/Idh/MocA family oxidoreductase [Sedimentisphaerales bacterium]
MNIGRANLAAEGMKRHNAAIKAYHSDDFDRMLREQKPDIVIVTTMDCTHNDYICRALKAGCDVITEKPMTTDEKKCQMIADTVRKTGRKVRVTFNYRYAPVRSQVKELLMSNVIGKILSVSFQWNLDTRHGADYFRRWHSHKANSGGLMVHKATHHFDLVNWWISSLPQSVFAMGDRRFYNGAQAKRLGLEKHGPRCHGCKLAKQCNFFLDMERKGSMKSLYLDQEQYDGYFRDKCVFRKDIDIEDTMNVVVRYRNGVIMSYALNAFLPWEGYRIEFNGTRGRLEHFCQESSYINGDGTVQGALKPDGTGIRIYPHWMTAYSVELRRGHGGHGGGDVVMLEDIFGKAPKDPLKRCADYVDGSYSILTGVAANKSMATGKCIEIDKLVKGLPQPNFTKMPGEKDRIPFIGDTRTQKA